MNQSFAQDGAGKNPVYLANGIKTGEADQTSAIVWARTTRDKTRVEDGVDFLNVSRAEMSKANMQARQIPEGKSLDEVKWSVPGAPGQLRVHYWPGDHKKESRATDWVATSADKDFTHQFILTELEPGTTYHLIVESRPASGSNPTDQISGQFQTAPAADVPADVRFGVVTGQMSQRRDDGDRGHGIYPIMRDKGVDFFVHTGDILYYDKEGPLAVNAELARYKWHRMYSYPNQKAFHENVTSYFIKDDHDTLKNDCWPDQNYGDLTWEQGLAIFREQVPMGEKTYRTYRWGKDLQIWLVEGRDFRSPNRAPDGPDKTIWGEEQKRWLFDSMQKSDASFRILISPTPIVGPDRGGKSDNHANKVFQHEGDEVRKFLSSLKNTYTVCGDRHWQYVSEDPETGLREYSCGPTTDKHAGGFSKDHESDMHKYLNIKGGFLTISIEHRNGKPVLVARHYSTDGSLYNEDMRTLEE
ncbi:MAG: alkaline phosphatase D family protein [Candidatus Sumerlaeia bacterium]